MASDVTSAIERLARGETGASVLRHDPNGKRTLAASLLCSGKHSKYREASFERSGGGGVGEEILISTTPTPRSEDASLFLCRAVSLFGNRTSWRSQNRDYKILEWTGIHRDPASI